MKVSSSTVEGLNIFGGNRSLYKLLSYTRTSGGDRLLKTWEVFNSPVSHLNLRFSVAIWHNCGTISSQFSFQSSILRCSK